MVIVRSLLTHIKTNYHQCRAYISYGRNMARRQEASAGRPQRTFAPKATFEGQWGRLGQASNVTTYSSTNSSRILEQPFDYFLVLDFEATCDNQKKLIPQEIIEFPVLKVSSKTFNTEAVFHQYVQPRIHTELTSFCTELTGIVQDMVDGQPYLEDTLQSFDTWMTNEGLTQEGVSSVFVTCGDWDLKTMLPSQAKYFNMKYPTYFNSWINIKKSFADVVGTYGKGMMAMMKQLNLKHEGRHHSGIDDCKNIAKILRELGQRGYIFRATGGR